MKEKEPVVEKMVTIMMMPEGRKVPNILVRRVVEHHSKIKKKIKKNPSILILMLQHWLEGNIKWISSTSLAVQ